MAVVVASHLPGEEPFFSERHMIFPVRCEGDFAYWAGLNYFWDTDEVIVNVEHDMDFTDELVDGLLACPEPLCAYPYQVYPTALGRYIYCATTDSPSDLTGEGSPDQPRWVDGPEDKWAKWVSIGFMKIAPEVRLLPLAKMFWQWLEHSVNHSTAEASGRRVHLHWPEVRHFHDYEAIPDHLW